MTRPRSKARWLEGGWSDYRQAYGAFRKIIDDAIAAGYEPGARLPEQVEPALHWLAKGEPDLQVKIADTIRHFTLCRVFANHLGFAAVDALGTEHHISVAVCLHGRQATHRTAALRALKREIEEQLQTARKQFSGRLCPETRVTLTKLNTELDYIGPSFTLLWKQFLFLERMTLKQVELHDENLKYLADRALATRWWSYFATYARFEGISKAGLKLREERRKQEPFREMST